MKTETFAQLNFVEIKKIKTQNWHAWINKMPPSPDTLHVRGEVEVSNPGIEVVTGVNLPMILKLADHSADDSLAEVSRRVREAGKEGIHVAGELLTPPPKIP